MKFCKSCGGVFDDAVEHCPRDGGTLLRLTGIDDAEGDPLVGEVLDDRYRIVDRIGQGGMGVVYRAERLTTGQPVAVKVIRGDVGLETARRFMVEAHATAALRSPHTVTLLDFGQSEGGALYLAMELLEGRSLHEELRGRGALPWPEALRVAKQVVASLREAHGKGIVHRDLKPGNVFLVAPASPGEPPLVKVLDFGVAKLEGGDLGSTLTATGAFLGTPSYMSPEQARGERATAVSDVYALGVLLYELISGRPPFGAPDPVALALQHCQDAPPPLQAPPPRPDVPPAVEGLVRELLAKQPRDRPSELGLLSERLDTLLESCARLVAAPSGGSEPVAAPTDGATRPAPGAYVSEDAPTEEPRPASAPALALPTADQLVVAGARGRSGRRALALGLVATLVAVALAWLTGLLADDLPGKTASRATANAVAGDLGVPAAPASEALVGNTGMGGSPAVEDAPPAASIELGRELARKALRGNEARRSLDAGGAGGEAGSSPPSSTVLIRTPQAAARVYGPGAALLGETPLVLPTPTEPLELTLRSSGHRARSITLAAGVMGRVDLKLGAPTRARFGRGRGPARRAGRRVSAVPPAAARVGPVPRPDASDATPSPDRPGPSAPPAPSDVVRAAPEPAGPSSAPSPSVSTPPEVPPDLLPY